MVNTLEIISVAVKKNFLCMPLEILDYTKHSTAQKNANKGIFLGAFTYFKTWLN